MRNNKSFFSYAFIVLLFTSAAGAVYCQDSNAPDSGQLSGTAGYRGSGTIAVRPVRLAGEAEASGAELPGELGELLQYRLLELFPSLGDFEPVEDESAAAILLTPAITEYRISSDQDLGIIVEMELRCALEDGSFEPGPLEEGTFEPGPHGGGRNIPYRTVVRAVGSGATHYAAGLRAVDNALKEYRRRLLASPLLADEDDTAALRVKDTLAGRLILNQGAQAGLQPGDEYRLGQKPTAGSAQNPGMVKIAEVYPDFAEAHVLYGREQLQIGTRLEPEQQLGLRVAVEGNYVYRMSTWQTAAEQLGGVSARLYYDRGLFSISPLLKVDYITNGLAFVHTGTALNWYVGRMKIAPSLLGGVGFSAGGGDPAGASQSLYWGASLELVLSWRINRRLLFSVSAGVSGWYHTGDAFEEARFIYTGSGFMLKY